MVDFGSVRLSSATVTGFAFLALLIAAIGGVMSWAVADSEDQYDEYLVFHGIVVIALCIVNLLAAIFGLLVPLELPVVRYALEMLPLVGVAILFGTSDQATSIADLYRRNGTFFENHEVKLASAVLQMLAGGVSTIALLIGLLFYRKATDPEGATPLATISLGTMLAFFASMVMLVGQVILWAGIPEVLETDENRPVGEQEYQRPIVQVSAAWLAVFFMIAAAISYREGLYVCAVLALGELIPDQLPINGPHTFSAYCDKAKNQPLDEDSCKAGFAIVWVGAALMLIATALFFYKPKLPFGGRADDDEEVNEASLLRKPTS